MVKLTCQETETHPVSKVLRDCGCIEVCNYYRVTTPYNGWFKKSVIVGRIVFCENITVKPDNSILATYVPERILAYRDLPKCMEVAKELEKIYQNEIEVKFVSKDYFVDKHLYC